MEPFQITTVFPDGTSVSRWATDEEIAQAEADRLAEIQRIAEREAAETAKLEKIESAKAKLLALGLSEEEVAAIVR